MDPTEYKERLKKTGRNDPCPCGSGKKYKKCHLPQDESAQHEEFAKAAEEREKNAAQAAQEEENGSDSKKLEKKLHHNIHEKGGKTHHSSGGQKNLPRRGAI